MRHNIVNDLLVYYMTMTGFFFSVKKHLSFRARESRRGENSRRITARRERVRTVRRESLHATAPRSRQYLPVLHLVKWSWSYRFVYIYSSQTGARMCTYKTAWYKTRQKIVWDAARTQEGECTTVKTIVVHPPESCTPRYTFFFSLSCAPPCRFAADKRRGVQDQGKKNERPAARRWNCWVACLYQW